MSKRFSSSIFTTLLCTLLSLNGTAQIANPNLSPAMKVRLYDYSDGKMSFSDSTTNWLVSAFSRDDSAVAALIDAGRPQTEILRYKDSMACVNESRLLTIMPPKERKEFENKVIQNRAFPLPMYKDIIEPSAEMNSLFGYSIKYAKDLKITDVQARQLLNGAAELRHRLEVVKANPEWGAFDKQAFESETVSGILTPAQFNDMIAAKNKKKSETQARYVWYEMESLSLTKNFNRDTSLKNITVYYLLKYHISDAFAHQKEKEELLLNQLRLPKELIALKEAKIGDRIKAHKYQW